MARSRDDADDRIHKRRDDDDQPRSRRRDDDDDDRPRRGRRNDDDDDYDRPRSRRRDDDDDFDDRPRRRRRDNYGRRPRLSDADLRTIAWSQKIIIFCILANLATIPLRFAILSAPSMAGLIGILVLAVYYLVVAITATVFVFMMAIKVYGTGTGIVLGLLVIIPLVGLITLLIINSKATAILKENDIRVGLLGARMSDLP